MKYWNGAVSPYSSPMNSIGMKGESTTAAAARRSLAGETIVDRRSPSMRLPIWSWFCAKTTNCSPSRVFGGAP